MIGYVNSSASNDLHYRTSFPFVKYLEKSFDFLNSWLQKVWLERETRYGTFYNNPHMCDITALVYVKKATFSKLRQFFMLLSIWYISMIWNLDLTLKEKD